VNGGSAARFPFPLPFGWFPVAWSDELAVGEVRPVRCFGRELALARFEHEGARVFDAHCPHLGAHLGYGGRVVADSLRCPFHGWGFGADGRCREVPYSRRIPPAARLRPWPVVERAGLVLAWYHPKGRAPCFDVPEVPELSAPDWTPAERREWVVRSAPQEMAENSVDQAHFRYVHGTETVAETELEEDGPVLRIVSKSRVGTPQGSADGRIDIHCHGFGYGVTRFRGVVETLVVTTGAPIDEEHVRMRLAFSVRRLGSADATRGVGRAFIAEIERQFEQDVPIWEHKIHLERPALCDGDGPIAALRRWGRQFYEDDASASPTSASSASSENAA
jgi:3-ketosteroid 9alpha-monooxygenase subunit A